MQNIQIPETGNPDKIHLGYRDGQRNKLDVSSTTSYQGMIRNKLGIFYVKYSIWSAVCMYHL
jgi:hypothetical protein